MKSKLDPQTTPAQKMERFQTALRSVVNVSHDQLKKVLVEDEHERRLRKDKPGPKPSSSASGHVVSDEV